MPFLKVQAQNLVSWGILTSLKFQYFISIVSFERYIIAENVFDTNDVIITSLEVTDFILALGLTTGCLESDNCYQFLIYFLFIQMMRSKLQKVANLTFYDVTVTS